MATKKTTQPEQTYAVIALAGKQYLVKTGDKIQTEKLEQKDGDKVVVTEVLLIHNDEQTLVGTPLVEGASVELVLDRTDKGEKIEIYKYKSKSRYRRHTGHRQLHSHLTVTALNYK